MTGVIIVGAGPAGLRAAEVISGAGVAVEVMDAMPSAGRKFLLAGRGGLNLTHAEPFELFVSRFGAASDWLRPMLQGLGPQAVRDWAHGLGVDTFVGSSQRVFPADMKAAPLLRAWLHRLRGQGVRFHMRHRFSGWDARGCCVFDTPDGPVARTPAALVLALGGASWSRLGSDGAWVPWLAARGVPVAPLQPANCGFDRAGGWSAHFASRFAGQPFKSVAITVDDGAGGRFARKGEFVATATGVEGSLIYAASQCLREAIAVHGRATVHLDLLPDHDAARVRAEVAHPRGSRSLSAHLKSRLGLSGIKMALLYEVLPRDAMTDAARLAATIKAVPIELSAPRPIDEAISTAGGVRRDALDAGLMLKVLPGVFCAGEMLDWEAPTGGYLLTACLASGRWAGEGAWRWLTRNPSGH